MQRIRVHQLVSPETRTDTKQLVGHEDTDPIVVQVATERRMKWKDDKPKFVTIKVKKEYTDNEQTSNWKHNLTIINDCIKRHWADLLIGAYCVFRLMCGYYEYGVGDRKGSKHLVSTLSYTETQ